MFPLGLLPWRELFLRSMKCIELRGKWGKGKYTMVDDADFAWLNQWRWYFDPHNGYVVRRSNYQRIYMHRLILNPPKGRIGDHANGNKLDHQRSNLRICTYSQNNANCHKCNVERQEPPATK